jgi:hypothetical protein
LLAPHTSAFLPLIRKSMTSSPCVIIVIAVVVVVIVAMFDLAALRRFGTYR